MRVDIRVALYVATVSVLSACAGIGSTSGNGPNTDADPVPSPPTVVQATTPPPAVADTIDFAMPDFSGMSLQDAQDTVQDLGIFFSKSHDLRGSRLQVLDDNWQVCTQSPDAGTRLKGKAADYEGVIDFGVVKLTETCP